MYDRIKMFQCGLYNNIAQHLNNTKDIVNRDTGEIIGYNGRLENLNISVYNSGVSIKGSLAKFMYKDNMISLNKKTTKEAICKISDTLKIIIDEAKISELEFGVNFLMKHPISMYLDLLKSAPYLEALRATIDTLYFRSKGKTKGYTGKNNKVLCFYDKVKEVEAREGLIPSVYANQNVLRYEIRYNGRLSRQLKTTDVTANRLYADDFYQLMKNNFTNNYNSIVKSNYMMSDEQEIKTVSDALKYMIANSIDEHKARSIMQGLKDGNTLKYPRDYTRLKSKFNEVTSMTAHKPNQDLAKELDDEIKNIIA